MLSHRGTPDQFFILIGTVLLWPSPSPITQNPASLLVSLLPRLLYLSTCPLYTHDGFGLKQKPELTAFWRPIYSRTGTNHLCMARTTPHDVTYLCWTSYLTHTVSVTPNYWDNLDSSDFMPLSIEGSPPEIPYPPSPCKTPASPRLSTVMVLQLQSPPPYPWQPNLCFLQIST